MGLLPQDFESCASTNSATAAREPNITRKTQRHKNLGYMQICILTFQATYGFILAGD